MCTSVSHSPSVATQHCPSCPAIRVAPRSKSDLLRGIIADIQLFYATMAFNDNYFSSLGAALQTLEFGDAANKVTMIAWLLSLGVDYTQLSIASFVHMKHSLCVKIFELLCSDSCCNPIRRFTSHLWHSRDLQDCEHGIVRCFCLTCNCGGICEHGPSPPSTTVAQGGIKKRENAK